MFINFGYFLSSYCGAFYCYELSWSTDCQDLGHLWELWAALFYSTVHMYIKLYCCVYLLGWFLITGTCDQLVEVIPYTSGCAYNQVPFSLNFQNWNIDIISTERVKIANSLLYHVKKKVVFLFEKKKCSIRKSLYQNKG